MMSNKKPTVWITNCMDISYNIYSIGLNFPEIIEYPKYEELRKNRRAGSLKDEEYQILNLARNRLIKNCEINYNFKKMDMLPDSMWIELLDPIIGKGGAKNIPDPKYSIFMVTDGYIIVTKSCAEILQQFRLLDTQMVPLQLFNPKTRELVNEETYFLLNIYAWRSYFDIKDNKDFRDKNYENHGYHIYAPPYLIKDGDCTISNTVLQCDIDLWHDPSVRGSIFLSQALRDALHKAKMLKPWFLHSCKMI